MTFLLPLWLLVSPAPAGTSWDELSPELQEAYEEAEQAWKEGRLEEAETAYITVTDASPFFAPALRRRCGLLLSDERVAEARVLCRRAAAIEPDHENITGLAISLSIAPHGQDAPGRVHLTEAKSLFDKVLAEHEDYVPAVQGMCTWAQVTGEVEALRTCVARLEVLRPDEAGTHYVRALLELEDDDLGAAGEALIAAKKAGLPDRLFRPLAATLTARGDGTVPVQGAPRGSDATDYPVLDALPWLIGAGLILAVGLVGWTRRDDI